MDHTSFSFFLLIHQVFEVVLVHVGLPFRLLISFLLLLIHATILFQRPCFTEVEAVADWVVHSKLSFTNQSSLVRFKIKVNDSGFSNFHSMPSSFAAPSKTVLSFHNPPLDLFLALINSDLIHCKIG